MVDLVVISSEQHRNTRVAVARATQLVHNAVSVVPREFGRLLAHFPLFFSKSAENGQFEPVALLGFDRAENLFLVNGLWDTTYVPLQVQRQPFSLAPRAVGGEQQLDIALDMSSPAVQSTEGERLFADNGQPSDYLRNVSSMLSALVAGSREAYAFTQRLTELNLLESVRVDIQFVNGSSSKLEGLFWIAAAVFKVLPAEQLAELRDREYLEWMYFQMASLSHMATLVARKNIKLSASGAGIAGGVRPAAV